jgi:MFS transporter, AAHS family, 4-hydroxybenzoate transporter
LTNPNNAPPTLLPSSGLSSLQLTTLAVCFVMNLLDGADVFVMSYTADALSKAWDIGKPALGAAFSAGLVGMALGTLLLAPLADKIGRKQVILISGAIMGLSIYTTSYAVNLSQLLAFRFVAGLGIGSMLACTAALAAEYTPNHSRNFWVSAVVAGYPIGGLLAGLVAAQVIPSQGWQQMFRLAGWASMASVPLAYLFMSESLYYYLHHQPAGALGKLNSILAQTKAQTLATLPGKPQKLASIPVGQLLTAQYRQATLLLWLALFMAFAALYFLNSWIPKLAKDAGLSAALAIHAGTIFSLGAFVGIITQGFFSAKFGLRRTLSIFLVCTGLLMASFGWFVGSDSLLLVFGLLGFGIQGGFVGLYALAARLYPASFRATGVGWAMGAGRIGGIVGPMAAGMLLNTSLGIAANFIIFAIPAILAGIFTACIATENTN